MPTTTSKNLGQVAAVIIGSVPPTNTNVVWVDNSTNPAVKKIYNFALSVWEPLTVAAQVAGDNWGSQIVVHSAELSGSGTAGVPLKLAQQGATTGQVLKWNGTAWIPENDDTGAGIVSVAHGTEFDGDGTVGLPLRLAAQTAAQDGYVLKWNQATLRWVVQAENTGPQFQQGMILMWAGDVAQIPGGWKLCDGNNGILVNGVSIPDLRQKFIAGYDVSNGEYNAIGKTGGANSVSLTAAENGPHTHGINDSGHSHSMSFGLDNGGNKFGSDWLKNSNGAASKNTSTATTGITIQQSGNGAAHENRPSFYVLAYIIKV